MKYWVTIPELVVTVIMTSESSCTQTTPFASVRSKRTVESLAAGTAVMSSCVSPVGQMIE